MLAAHIVAIFPALGKFLAQVSGTLSKPQRQHFYAYLLALAISFSKRKTISEVARTVPAGAACSVKRFLTEAPVDDQALRSANWQFVRERIEQSNEGGCGYLVIDDTPVEKRGRHIQGTCGHRLDASIVYWGHRFVSAFYLYGPYKLPLGYRLYLNKKYCKAAGQPYRSKGELALELLGQFQPPKNVATVVLFDCWYNSPALLKAIRKRRFHYVTRVRSSRHVGSGRNLQDICKWAQQHRDWRRPLPVAGRSYMGFSRILNTKRVGKQKFAVIYDLESTESAAECIYLMSSLLTARAATIVSHYLHRWEIETFYQDAKQLLGLGDYQTRALPGVHRHLLMVDVAYTALRLQGAQQAGDHQSGRSDAALTLGALRRQAHQRTVVQLVEHIIAEHNKGATADQIAHNLPINI